MTSGVKLRSSIHERWLQNFMKISKMVAEMIVKKRMKPSRLEEGFVLIYFVLSVH